MKKTDIGLIVIVILLALSVFTINIKWLVVHGTSYEVEARVDGEIYGVYSLDKNQTILIQTDAGTNKILIQDGYVNMVDADCRDLICVNTKAISKPSQSIVCLPHRVSVEIHGVSPEESDVDVISQ
jgi:hypothetical protein